MTSTSEWSLSPLEGTASGVCRHDAEGALAFDRPVAVRSAGRLDFELLVADEQGESVVELPLHPLVTVDEIVGGLGAVLRGCRALS